MWGNDLAKGAKKRMLEIKDDFVEILRLCMRPMKGGAKKGF